MNFTTFTAFILIAATTFSQANSPAPPQSKPESRGVCTVRGKVTRYGQPVVEGAIILSPHFDRIPKTKLAKEDWRCKVDKLGAFLLEGVPPGPCSILYYRDHDTSNRLFVIPDTPSTDIVIDLSSSVITGRVVDKQGLPVKNVMVYAETTSEPSNERPFLLTNSQGEYKIDLLDPGTYRVNLITSFISIQSPQFVTFAGQHKIVTIKDGEAAELNFALEYGAEGEIEMVDPTGKPVRGGQVHAMIAMNDPARTEYLATAQTDEKGVDRLIGFPAGDYVARVTVDYNMHRFIYSSITKIEIGKPFKIRLVVDEPVVLKIDASDATGELIPLHTVKVFDELDLLVAKSGTRSGKPELTVHVPRGRLRVTGKTGELDGTAEIDLSDGKPQTLHLQLKSK